MSRQRSSMFFNDWLRKRCLYTPNRVAVVDDTNGRRYTYSELDARAARQVTLLRQTFGLRSGDRVACLATNRLEYLDLFFGCARMGAVLVPLNTRLPVAGILELLADCQPQLQTRQRGLLFCGGS